MENKYKGWFEGFSSVVEEQLGKEKKDQIVSQCEECSNISNDSQMTKCVRKVMNNFDSLIDDESKRNQVMETMGNYCVQNVLPTIKEIKKKSNNLDELIENLNQTYGGEFFTLKEDQIHSELDKCFCHFGVQKTEIPLSRTYCQCSLGYMKLLFSTLLDRSVKVELKESILTGGDKCKFIIYLES